MSDSIKTEGERKIRASFAVIAVVLAVVAMPLIAHFIDDRSDEYSLGRFPAWPALGWLACGLLAAVLITRILQRVLPIVEGPVLAVTYDALPLLLVIAWLVLPLAVASGHWLLAASAAVLCVAHLALLAPRLRRAHVPGWARKAPRLKVLVANVYTDNPTPEEAARQIVEIAADVAVIAEATGDFLAVFDANGGEAYPHRVLDDDPTSDYAVAVLSRRELGTGSEFRIEGPLRVAVASVDVKGETVRILGLNPMAAVDPGGQETWVAQIDVLCELLPTLDGHVVVAGDMNTTSFRPEFDRLLSLGLVDAVDALGKGLSPSFRLRASGLLSRVGAVARLDHALVSTGLHPLRMRNLPAKGSDHLPFVIELAVRPRQGPSRRWWSKDNKQKTP